MSSLDSKTLKDFAQAIIGETGAGSSLRYGTVQSDQTGTYVMIDGSSTYTPALGNVDVRPGDRVTIEFINHQAVIIANASTPSSGYVAHEQPIRVFTEYAKNQSQTIPPESGWSETLPDRGENEYIWSRMVNAFSNGTTTTDAPKVITGQNGKDALVCGVKNPVCVLNGPASGVQSGTICSAELYARLGVSTKNISVNASDIICPTGIVVHSITGNGSPRPIINFVTTTIFSTSRTATINMTVENVRYSTILEFSVALNGQDGKPSYNLILTSTNGTIFTDHSDSTTINADLKYGNTDLMIDSQGFVYNKGTAIGRLRWVKTRATDYIYADEIPILGSEVTPYMLVSVEFGNVSFDEIYTKNEIALAFCSNIRTTARYYQKRNSLEPTPLKPTTYPPPSTWTLTEPPITETDVSTDTVYYVEVVEYTDDSFTYSDVSEYTAFVSSKFALAKAIAALSVADGADTKSDEAKQDAYDALIAATAYLKLDPLLEKIVISKLGTSTWKTFAIDSTGCSIGEYIPSTSTVPGSFSPYATFDINGFHMYTKITDIEDDDFIGWISMDHENPLTDRRNLLDYRVELKQVGTDSILYETSNMTTRFRTASNEIVNLASTPDDPSHTTRGSGFSMISGGHNPLEDKSPPGFAAGTYKETYVWEPRGTSGASDRIPSLASNDTYTLARKTGVGVIAADVMYTGNITGVLQNNPSLNLIGIRNNTVYARWPSFWAFNSLSASDIADSDSTYGMSISDYKIPIIGFRGLMNIKITNTATESINAKFVAYVSNVNSNVSETIDVTIPIAYPITKQSTIVVNGLPARLRRYVDGDVRTIYTQSATAEVDSSSSNIILHILCDIDSYFPLYDIFCVSFVGTLTISIT